MSKFVSNRQQNLKIGITSYTENKTVLEVTGNVGIKTSNTQGYELYVAGDANVSGIISASEFYGSGINLTDLIQTINISKIQGIGVEEEGVGIGTTFTSINFVGPNVAVTGSGNTATVTVLSLSDLSNNQNFGSISDGPSSFTDLGLITEVVVNSYDFGVVFTTGIVRPSEFILPSFTINTLPSANPAGKMLFVTDETGGSVPAFSDGTNWRRITDRQIVS